MLTILNSNISLAHQFIGLSPSISALSQSEAITSTAQGTDCLFYNPATLPVQRPHLSILGVEGNTDRDSISRVEDYQSGESAVISGEDFALEEFYKKLNSDKPIRLSTTARVLDLVLPYFSLSSIGSVRASSARNIDSYTMKTEADIGAIGGVGFSIWRFSFGLARYGLLRVGVESSPSTAQFNAIDTAIKDKTFTPQLLPFREFTSFQYGGLNGTNAGLLFRFLPDNQSGIGLAVLNAGSAKSSRKAPIDREDFRQLENELFNEAQSHSLELTVPADIPQIINLGTNLAYGNPEEPFFAQIAIDYHDINGDYIQNKLAIASEVALILTDKAALASAWPVYSRDNLVYHMGLLGLRGFFSIRPSSYLSYGIGMSFHFGTQMKISLLKLDVDAFELKTLESDNSIDTTQINELDLLGLSAKLALTLIF